MGPNERKKTRVTWTIRLILRRQLPRRVQSHFLEKDSGALETREEGKLERWQGKDFWGTQWLRWKTTPTVIQIIAIMKQKQPKCILKPEWMEYQYRWQLLAEEEKVIGKGWKEAANGSRETPMENRAGEGMKWQTRGSWEKHKPQRNGRMNFAM